MYKKKNCNLLSISKFDDNIKKICKSVIFILMNCNLIHIHYKRITAMNNLSF